MPHQRQASGSGFKSRFSLASLLPARHPTLVISHPAPALPTQHVHRGQPVFRSHDRVESSYGTTADDPFDVDYEASQYSKPGSFSPERPKHRPPPLDLARTKAVFPTVKGIDLVRDDPSPTATPVSPPILPVAPPKRNESLPVVRGTGDLKKAASKAGRMFKPFVGGAAADDREKAATVSKNNNGRRPAMQAHDSYDFVTLEPEHRYPSWKAGKVDIRPGEHIPPDLIRPVPTRGRSDGSSIAGKAKRPARDGTPSPEPEQYESVLHNVLLTPTYLAPSTASKSTTDLMRSKERGKRQTLLGRASRSGKDVLSAVPAVGGSIAQYGRSATHRQQEQREEREMKEVWPATKPRPMDRAATPQAKRERAVSSASASSVSTPSPAIRGVVGTPYRRSPARTSMREREESIGDHHRDRDHKSRSKDDVKPQTQGTGGKRPLVGFNVTWQAGDGKRSVSGSEAWSSKKKKEQDIKRKRLLWRVSPRLRHGVCKSITGDPG